MTCICLTQHTHPRNSLSAAQMVTHSLWLKKLALSGKGICQWYMIEIRLYLLKILVSWDLLPFHSLKFLKLQLPGDHLARWRKTLGPFTSIALTNGQPPAREIKKWFQTRQSHLPQERCWMRSYPSLIRAACSMSELQFIRRYLETREGCFSLNYWVSTGVCHSQN